jgi:hypothetical protein
MPDYENFLREIEEQKKEEGAKDGAKEKYFNNINILIGILIELYEDCYDIDYLLKYLNHILICYRSSDYAPLICFECKNKDCDNCKYIDYNFENEIEDFINNGAKII